MHSPLPISLLTTTCTEVPTLLVAGHETTSTATTWALFALAQALGGQEALRAEVRGVRTDAPEMDELDALPYLDMVVRETLRLHAAVTVVMRDANKEDVIPLPAPLTDNRGLLRIEIRYVHLYHWPIGRRVAKDTGMHMHRKL